jgi:hypothetical protein
VKAKLYTKLDVQETYNSIWVEDGDEHKLAFRTWYGLIQPIVIQFGTTNAPANFQGNINNAIREAVDDIALAYQDDISICSKSEKEHIGHLRWVKKCLLDAGWYLKPEKCKFHNKTVRYLQLIISTKGISMDESKIEKVWNWTPEMMTNNVWLNNML